jgi:hypothetical protein
MLRYVLGPDARARALEQALCDHARIAIAGGPETGKSTYVEGVTDREVIHADLWKGEPFEEQPNFIIAACAPFDRFIVEGCQVPRALRKGLEVDCLIWLARPVAERTPKQVAFGKGVETVFESIREKLTVPVFVCP